jgi:hypothetical protein
MVTTADLLDKYNAIRAELGLPRTVPFAGGLLSLARGLPSGSAEAAPSEPDARVLFHTIVLQVSRLPRHDQLRFAPLLREARELYERREVLAVLGGFR